MLCIAYVSYKSAVRSGERRVRRDVHVLYERRTTANSQAADPDDVTSEEQANSTSVERCCERSDRRARARVRVLRHRRCRCRCSLPRES